MVPIIRRAAPAALFLVAGLASGHPTLVGSSPKSGEALDVAPKEIRLSFNEPVEPAFTNVKMVSPSGKEGPAKPTQAVGTDPRTVGLPFAAPIAGLYKARWSALGRDGHRVRGEFSFTVK
jgi:methionine-rich copper-binding protein CopC